MIQAVNLKKWKALALWLLGTLAAGIFSSLLAGDVQTAYANLIKPQFAPPAALFPIVWTILYLLLGLSAYLVWSAGVRRPGVREALFYYAVGLAANVLWLPIFFRWELYGFAVVWLGMMLILAAITAYQFYRIHRLAGVIVLVYLLWLVYAFVLAFSVCRLNP